MKKFYFFVSIALMTLMLVPSTLKADDCPFTPNIYPGQAENRTAFDGKQSHKRHQKRTFPGTVGADHSGDPVRCSRQTDAVQHRNAASSYFHIFDL